MLTLSLLALCDQDLFLGGTFKGIQAVLYACMHLVLQEGLHWHAESPLHAVPVASPLSVGHPRYPGVVLRGFIVSSM